jgi:hypothetical protein
MNKIILTAAAVAGLGISSHAQSILFEDNSGASFDNEIIDGVPNTTQDLNLELLLGTTANVSVDVVTLLLSSSAEPSGPGPVPLGGTYSAAGDISIYGHIYDQSDDAYNLSAYAGSTVYLQVDAWTGNYSSYIAAELAGAPSGQSKIFSTSVGDSPTSFPADVSGVGSIELFAAPEPGTMALAGLGGLALLFLRHKK